MDTPRRISSGRIAPGDGAPVPMSSSQLSGNGSGFLDASNCIRSLNDGDKKGGEYNDAAVRLVLAVLLSCCCFGENEKAAMAAEIGWRNLHFEHFPFVVVCSISSRDLLRVTRRDMLALLCEWYWSSRNDAPRRLHD